MRALLAALLAPGAAVAWLVVAQVAFDHGHVLAVAAPLFALALGTVATIAAGYLAERRRRHRFAVRNEALEEAVHERTAELRETQLEIIQRLGRRDRVARRGDRAAPRAHRPALRAASGSCWA